LPNAAPGRYYVLLYTPSPGGGAPAYALQAIFP
jgi:hypothetical protein